MVYNVYQIPTINFKWKESVDVIMHSFYNESLNPSMHFSSWYPQYCICVGALANSSNGNVQRFELGGIVTPICKLWNVFLDSVMQMLQDRKSTRLNSSHL